MRPEQSPNGGAPASNVFTTVPTPPVSVDASSTSPPPARRRRTVGLKDCCRTCRARKVKCSGNPDGGPCTNCQRLSLDCSFAPLQGSTDRNDGKIVRTTPSQIHTEAGTLRKRIQKACRPCHAQKTKCSGERPTCKRCEAAGIQCHYATMKRKFNHVPDSDESAVQNEANSAAEKPLSISPISDSSFPLSLDIGHFSAEERFARKNIILTHMDAYMKFIYWVPCLSFLHPPSTYASIQDGSFPPVQAAALCAVTSFFVNPGEEAREFGVKCNDQVEFHIFRNIHRFSETNLILFCLNMGYNFLSGTFAKVWQCFGLASRVMTGLHLPWDGARANRTFAQQESSRRLAWHLFCFDRLLAGGYDEYTSTRVDWMKIRLPCNENAFRRNQPAIADRIADRPSLNGNGNGLHGYAVRLVDLRHRINTATRKLTVPPGGIESQVEPSAAMTEINMLQHELNGLTYALPDEFKLSDQNIAKFVRSPDLHGYVYLQTHIAVCYMDLYRFSLPGLQESPPTEILRKLPPEFIAKSQKQAVAHAISMGRFCDAVQREFEAAACHTRGEVAGDSTISHMATQCLRVLLTALQRNLYHDLVEHTSAPLWRQEPADEAHIQSLFEALFRICEPWCPLLITARHAHDSNQEMVRQFGRTGKFSDPGRPAPKSPGSKQDGDTRLPGPHFILSNANFVADDTERRTRPEDATAAAQWFRTPGQSPKASSPYPGPETGMKGGDFAPPGVPMLLAQARGVSLGSAEPNMYDVEAELLAMQQNRQWPMEEYMMQSLDEQMMGAAAAAAGMPMVPMNNDAGHNGYQPAPGHPHNEHFMQPQTGVFMNSYQTHYTTEGAAANGYMNQPHQHHHHQQAGFG